MTYNDLYAALSTLDCQIAYVRFPEPQIAPFIVWALDADDDFKADDSHYFPIKTGWVELYTDILPHGLQDAVEAILDGNKVPYEKSNEVYIKSENLFLTRWDIQLLGGK